MSAAAERFDRLVAEHHGAVLRICRSILREEHLGRDAAQEAFLRLWRRVERAEPWPDRPLAWLRRAAVSAAIDLRRRRAPDGPDGTVSTVAPGPARATGATPAPGKRGTGAAPGAWRDAADRELFHRLEAALARLPDGQRTVFSLRHDGGLSLREVAAVLGVSTSTAKTQFARACLRLQASLGSDLEPGSEA